MTLERTPEGWSIIGDDHSHWSHSDLVRERGRIDIELLDLPSQDFISPYLRPGSVVIDVGAHIGCFTIPMMRVLGTEGLVVAFEPQSDLYQCLSANIEKERRDNAGASDALPFREAVGNQSGWATFLPDPENYGAGMIAFGQLNAGPKPASRPSHPVHMLRLDDLRGLFKDRGLGLSFMKIDCEGSEIDVVRGAHRLIKEHHPVLFIEVNQYAFAARGITQSALEEELQCLGYGFRYFPDEWVQAGKPAHDLLAIHAPT